MPATAEPNVPFRWDLISPDTLGTLLDDGAAPNLWFSGDLVECAGKVMARSGNGDLFFVGRSLDSMFDLLGGALEDTDWRDQLHRLPVSFALSGGARRITRPHVERAREILTALGLSPYALARRARPAAFVDVVHGGNTFTKLFHLVRAWIDETHEPWAVIRRKMRFVGVTSRTKTSPNTFRWHQHAAWTRELRARSVVNVSLDPYVWAYLGNDQIKLTHTFRPADWLEDPDGPARGERLAPALAEALALVEFGRSRSARSALAREMAGEPAVSQAWLRSLIVHLNTR